MGKRPSSSDPLDVSPSAQAILDMDRRLSIAMVAPCAFPTRQGTQVFIRHLATALARAGHEVHLITYGYGEYEETFPFHLHRAPRVQAGLRSGPNILKPAADAALLIHAGRVVRAHNCDLLHVHNVEGLGVGALLKLQLSLPLVYHAHNAMGPELPTYFRQHMAQAFASVVGEVIDRTLPRTADAVIAFDSDHKSMHEVYGIHEGRLHVIPPGLDSDELKSPDPVRVAQLSGELGPGPWLIYAGNPDAYQNLPLLWQAYALVREKLPSARLLVATNYDASTFERPLEDAPSREGIVVRRYHDVDELRALLAVSDLAVCPRSLWAGAPIKIINYMAAGLPIVAVRSGARHLVDEGFAGVVDDDPHAFAEACLEWLGSPGDYKRRQRHALEKFRIENHVPMYEAVYRRVLARHAELRRA